MKSTPSASPNRRKNHSMTFPVHRSSTSQIARENPGWYEYIPGGFVVTDASGTVQAANLEACEILQISPDLVRGMQITNFIKADKRPDFENHVRSCLELAHRSKISAEIGLENRAGKVITFSLRSVPDSQSRERLLYWTLHPGLEVMEANQQAEREKAEQAEAAVRFRDTFLLDAIHERERVSNVLKTSTAHFRTIFEQADLGIQLLDLQGTIVESNPAFQKMLGYNVDELQNKRLTDITHLEDLENLQEQFNNQVSGKLETYRGQIRLIHKSGKVVWTRQIMSLFRDGNGQPQYVISMLENNTPQKQMEMELSEVQQRLIESREAERLRLAQDLHDGPVQDLYGISYQLSSMWSSFGDRESYPEVKAIESALEGVIQSLRQMCGELRPPALAPFGLEKAILSHAQGIKEKSPEIQITLDLLSDRKTLPENVRLALFRIYQIAIANVLRHAEAQNILIHFSFDDDQVILSVQDDGTGFQMPPRWVELVRQGHFGLVGAAERAQSIGGKLTIESQPGKGTILRVTVPRNPYPMGG